MEKPKTISIVIPTFNEEANVPVIYTRTKALFSDVLAAYHYEIIFIDNYSEDNTRKLITEICRQDKDVKAIFNASNFGFVRSQFYGLTQATGDCAVLMCADLQEPPGLIPEFVREWEQGEKIVLGIKNKSRESSFIYSLRTIYYRFVQRITDVKHISHFTGFGLYSQDFINVLRKLEDPQPYLRGIVAELGCSHKEIYYTQAKRERGKSKFGFFKLYDLAMLGITSYSKVVLRLATMIGFLAAVVSLIIALITLIIKLANWHTFPIGVAAISIGIFFFGAVQLLFIGLLGEYILSINTRVMKRPLVVEESRLNFGSPSPSDKI